MSLSRIRGIILQEIFITRNSLETIVDLFYFAIMSVVLFGYFSIYLAGSSKSDAARYLILGILLWEVVRTAQYSISVSSLWNIWSRNLSNMFITPLSITEFIVAQIISCILKTSLMFLSITVIAYYMYNFNILDLGVVNLVTFIFNLILFSTAIGLIIVGLIFRIGVRIQAFAWGLIYLFQPLAATLFPVSVLPTFLQPIAYAIPATYVFEGARLALHQPTFSWHHFLSALSLNLIYLTVALLFFSVMYKGSRRTGQFARNES